MAGYEGDNVYNVPVHTLQQNAEQPSEIERSLYDFLMHFRTGGEFLYRSAHSLHDASNVSEFTQRSTARKSAPEATLARGRPAPSRPLQRGVGPRHSEQAGRNTRFGARARSHNHSTRALIPLYAQFENATVKAARNILYPLAQNDETRAAAAREIPSMQVTIKNNLNLLQFRDLTVRVMLFVHCSPSSRS